MKQSNERKIPNKKGRVIKLCSLHLCRFVSITAEPITDKVSEDKLLFFVFLAHSAPLPFAPHSFLSL